MDAGTFNRMLPDQQLALLELAGTCINQRYEPKFIIYLYRAFDVLVEAYYHHKCGFVNASVVSGSSLDFYLEPAE